MSNPQPKEFPVRWDLMILLLAVAGGSLDAVMILAFNVLTGAQTGNTVLLGAAIAQHQFATALASTVSVGCYVIGAALGELIIVRCRDTWAWPRSSAVGAVLITELILIGCLFIFWRMASPHPVQETICVLVAFAASAMGVQSSALLRLHRGPATTYITGTLATFATGLIEWLHLVEAKSTSSPARQDYRPWIYGSTWLVYLTAVVAGGFFFLHAKETALLLPIAAILVCIVLGVEGKDVGVNEAELSASRSSS